MFEDGLIIGDVFPLPSLIVQLFAVVAKTHHACADGQGELRAGQEFTAAMAKIDILP